MTTRIVVPAKALSRGKSRLAPVLDEADRRALSLRFLDSVLRACLAARGVAPGCVRIVSDGEDALARAAPSGVAALAQSGRGLNRALDQARRAARQDGAAALVVLSSDLPFVAAGDVERLLAAAAPGVATVAPDRAGRGTNALALPAAADFRFRFGRDSAAAHGRRGPPRRPARGDPARAPASPSTSTPRATTPSSLPATGDAGHFEGIDVRRLDGAANRRDSVIPEACRRQPKGPVRSRPEGS